MASAARPRLSWVAVALGALLVLGALLLYRGKLRDRAEQEAFSYERLPRALAPDISFGKAGGTSQRLSELRGKVVLLHFWATWCPPCRKELPALLEFGRKLAASGNVRLVALSTESEWGPIVDYFSGSVPSEVFFDASGEAKEAYQPNIIPETYLISPDGALRLRFSGPMDWQSPEALRAVQQAGSLH